MQQKIYSAAHQGESQVLEEIGMPASVQTLIVDIPHLSGERPLAVSAVEHDQRQIQKITSHGDGSNQPLHVFTSQRAKSVEHPEPFHRQNPLPVPAGHGNLFRIVQPTPCDIPAPGFIPHPQLNAEDFLHQRLKHWIEGISGTFHKVLR